jgi:hypothetical protein
MKNIILICILLAPLAWSAQTHADKEKDGVKYFLNSDSSAYLKFMGTLQVWLRYTQNNPGSGLQYPGNPNFYQENETVDLGIRRARFQLFGPLHKRVFFYSQFGINNFSSQSTRKQGAFFHDLVTEVHVIERTLSIGAGLTGWSGLSRYSSPSVASTLMYDAPLFQQATNDITDQFLRKFSVYAKGKIKKLDYRAALSKPMPVQTASIPTDTSLNASFYNISVFSPQPPKLQTQAYLNWQFLEEESNLTPYTVGTYLGKKRVFNLGAGLIHQADAMRHEKSANQIEYTNLLLWSADAFLDYALDREKQTAITLYASYSDYDFGPNYSRSLGVMNPMNASNNPLINKFSAYGNAFPMCGSGQIMYLQSAYLFKHDLLKSLGSVQVYADGMLADYEVFNDPMLVWDAGVNWLIKGHGAKISFNYQNRPVFQYNPSNYTGSEVKGERKGMYVLQMQAAF